MVEALYAGVEEFQCSAAQQLSIIVGMFWFSRIDFATTPQHVHSNLGIKLQEGSEGYSKDHILRSLEMFCPTCFTDGYNRECSCSTCRQTEASSMKPSSQDA